MFSISDNDKYYYVIISACEDNQVWSNTSLCQRTCTERFGDFNDTLCTIESEGCVCEADLYLDETGTCVNTSECDKCYVNGTEWIVSPFRISKQ